MNLVREKEKREAVSAKKNFPAGNNNESEKTETPPRLRIKIKSYDSKIVDASCRQIIDIARRTGVEIRGPVPLPTEIKKYTVNRSTFIHKDAREQFEIRIHKRLIEILNPNARLVEALRDLALPTGVEIEIKNL